MKCTLIISLLFVCSMLTAQDNARFSNFHGIKHDGSHYFEAEGYQIFIHTESYGLDEKGISKIVKKYDMKEAQRIKDEQVLDEDAIVLIKKSEEGSVLVYYLLFKDDYSTTVIGFGGPEKRNVDLEHLLVNAYIQHTIPSSVYTSTIIDSVNFVGRTIRLGNACQWMAPHNIQCPDLGQMNWSIFDSEQAAIEQRDLQFERIKKKSLTEIQEEVWVPVKFEGVEAQAKRIRVKIKIPKFVMAGSNVLMVYFVAANVRGKNVSCVLSHYTDDVSGKTLAPLLREVLELTK